MAPANAAAPAELALLERKLKRANARASRNAAFAWMFGATAGVLALALLLWAIGSVLSVSASNGASGGENTRSEEPDAVSDATVGTEGTEDPAGSGEPRIAAGSAPPAPVDRLGASGEPVSENLKAPHFPVRAGGAESWSGEAIDDLTVDQMRQVPVDVVVTRIAGLVARDTPASLGTAERLVRTGLQAGLSEDQLARVVLTVEVRQRELAAQWLP